MIRPWGKDPISEYKKSMVVHRLTASVKIVMSEWIQGNLPKRYKVFSKKYWLIL